MSVLLHLAAALLSAVPLSQAAQAQPLVDPTRPPNVSASQAAGPAAGEAAPGPLRVESILIAPGRRLAVVGGRTVSVGGKLDDATVVEIAETHVLLRQGAEMKRLPLYPGVERKPTKTAQAAEKKKEDRE